MCWYISYSRLAQHIKNTDFLYKYKLPTQHKVPEPFNWDDEFAVFVSIFFIFLLCLKFIFQNCMFLYIILGIWWKKNSNLD